MTHLESPDRKGKHHTSTGKSLFVLLFAILRFAFCICKKKKLKTKQRESTMLIDDEDASVKGLPTQDALSVLLIRECVWGEMLVCSEEGVDHDLD